MDLGWSELFVIAIVALVVIGPRDLPAAMRSLSKFLGQARHMAREFQTGFDQMVREADLEDVRRDLSSLRSLDPKAALRNALDPEGDVARAVRLDHDVQSLVRPASGQAAAASPGGGEPPRTPDVPMSAALAPDRAAQAVSLEKTPAPSPPAIGPLAQGG